MRKCTARVILVARNDEMDSLVVSLTVVSKWACQAPGPEIAQGMTHVRAIPAIACSGRRALPRTAWSRRGPSR